MEYLYLIVEENVDGCGGNAEEYIRLSSQLDAKQTETLKHCLERVKNNNTDTDTAGMIEDALSLFEAKTGIIGKLCSAPYHDIVKF